MPGVELCATPFSAAGLRSPCTAAIPPEDRGIEAARQGHYEEPGLVVVIDGYLDNRESLGAALRLPAPAAEAPADARLVCEAWKRWRESGLGRLQGPFALAIADLRRSDSACFVLYREPLGRRGLHYRATAEILLVASEPAPLLAYPQVSREPDDGWLTRYFALARPIDSSTPFRDIRKLLPGECLLCTGDGIRLTRERLALGARPIRYRREEEYAQHFLSLLDRAVGRSLIDSGVHTGIMLSGGMDSAPLAALAHRRLSTAGRALHAYSWSLTGYPSADEASEIETCTRHIGCGLTPLPGAQEWPLRDLQGWPVNPSSPVANPYRRLKLAVYRAAARGGCRVLLNGASGDILYPHPGSRLTDALRDRRLGLALSEIARTAGSSGIPGLWRDPGLRRLGKQILFWRARPAAPPAWLASGARQRWREACPPWPPESVDVPDPERFQSALGQWAADGVSEEVFFAARCGIDRRDPFRDADLIDFMLSIPGYICYRHGQTKWLAREAMRDWLPESIRLRPRGGLMTPFFDAGYRRALGPLRTLLTARDAAWPDYVDRRWLLRALDAPEPSDREKLVVWYCAAFELWRRALDGSHPQLLDFARGDA